MKEYNIDANIYLSNVTKAYYSCKFTGYGTDGNPDYLNIIKNQFGNTNSAELTQAYKKTCYRKSSK